MGIGDWSKINKNLLNINIKYCLNYKIKFYY